MTLRDESVTARETVCLAQSTFWPERGAFQVVCGLRRGHDGPHVCIGPAPDVHWEWTDEDFVTRYPDDPR